MQINGLYFKPKAKKAKIFKFIIKLRRFRIKCCRDNVHIVSTARKHTFFKKKSAKTIYIKKKVYLCGVKNLTY